MKRKKMMFYTMIMQKGGTETTITNLSNYFISNYDITIVTNIKKNPEYNLDNRVKFLSIDKKDKSKENIIKKIFTKLSYKRSKILKKIIKNEKPDIIITFLPEPTIRMLALKKHFKHIPVIVSIRNHPKKEYYYPLLKLVRDYYYNKADLITIQDDKYKKYLSNNILNRIKVIPNFISEEFNDNNKNKTREKKIVTVTRLEPQKNVPLLIKAFSNLNKKYNDYKLYICGIGSQKNNLEKLIKELNLEDRIFLLGRVEDIKKTIKNASLFVLPSNYEGMPNVLLEAMSLSLPVISTRSTEVIDNIITNNVNGIIVEKNNILELTKKMEYILDNPAIANSLANEASKIKQKYNKEKTIKKWEKLFKHYVKNLK